MWKKPKFQLLNNSVRITFRRIYPGIVKYDKNNQMFVQFFEDLLLKYDSKSIKKCCQSIIDELKKNQKERSEI